MKYKEKYFMTLCSVFDICSMTSFATVGLLSTVN